MAKKDDVKMVLNTTCTFLSRTSYVTLISLEVEVEEKKNQELLGIWDDEPLETKI